MSDIADSVELAPCPFCGGAADRDFTESEFGGAIWVSCSECGADGPGSSWQVCVSPYVPGDGTPGSATGAKWAPRPWEEQQAEAIASWNRRSVDAAALRAFVAAIEHGPPEHREWLRRAAEAAIAGEPVPEPR